MIAPFRIPEPTVEGVRGGLMALARPALERALAFPRLNELYAEALSRPGGESFADRALGTLDIRCEVAPGDLERIPSSGPVVVAANHPFGGADGLVLLSTLRRVRPDVKVLGNHLLEPIPDLGDSFIYLDPFGGPGAAPRNVAGLRRALRWLAGGGLLAVFPAGEVSHLSLRSLRVADPPWSESVGRLVRRAGAPVVPVWFEGSNRPLFHVAGLLHPRLRTALLPRELLARRGARVRLRVGSIIRAGRLARFPGARQATDYLRLRSELLRYRAEDPGRPAPGVPIASPQPASRLAREAGALAPAQRLLESGPYDVLFARAPQIPAILEEIGRLREISFRGVGEGTGRASDTDRFDAHYLHLFVWNREKSELVGAYRMGPTDEILPRLGVEGLYTSTLFRYGEPLISRIDPALELGRSFVRPEYQREPQPLALLWKGIGRFVVAHPRYRRLFGPVSISSRYHSMSRHLLMIFLKMNRFRADLARLVAPRHRPRFEDPPERLLTVAAADLDEVDDLIAEIEAGRAGVPVLLRQYLKLNARLIGFSVDPAFGDVLDGLVLIDLTEVDRHILSRYMGREGSAAFLAGHGLHASRMPGR